MKILISADWHLGKKLHHEDFSPDMDLFFNWLLNYIKENAIDYLLVAGDIFDQNNPANDATRQFYTFLKNLNQVSCKAIITAGNHDSASFLDVPKVLLDVFDIKVIGTFPGIENVDQIFIPLKDKDGHEVAVVAAIPFLQDRFIRHVGEGEGALDISRKIKDGMKKIFKEIGLAMKTKYPDLLKIGMAHLHAQGTESSEAEREIQIGNQEGISSKDLDQFDYLCLGHIHTGQAVIDGRIHYAGSPISLGFTENSYRHKVIQLDINKGEFSQTNIPIPKFRSLYQVKGTMQEVEDQVGLLKNKYALTALLDIKIEEPSYDPTLTGRLETIKAELPVAKNIKVANIRIAYTEKVEGRIARLIQCSANYNLQPSAVFGDLIIDRADEEKEALQEIFNEIVSDLTQTN